MNRLLYRIKRRYEMTIHNWKNDCEFSKKLAWFRLIDDLGGRIGFHELSGWAHSKKDEWILNYLQDMLEPIIQKYKNCDDQGILVDNAPIWVCWWSGEDEAPALVKQCIKSIRKNAGVHPVYLITEKNYAEYIDIPSYILNKVLNGTMCIANFTDYLRATLIEKYGGLWLDATIFCSNQIPEECFDASFYTCKSHPVESRYISQFRWTSFCLGGWKNHVFYRFFKEALEKYWRDEDVSIDYLLVDYIIETAYRYLPTVRQCMDEIMPNNPHRDDLQAAMNKALPAQEFWNVIKEDTCLYKLSWRETYSKVTSDEKQSVYGYFVEGIE